MRKYISLITVVIFLFDLGGYFLWFSACQKNLQKEIRHEIRKGLRKDDLSLIIVSGTGKPGISWIKPGKEFTYHGEMYDVVKMEVHNGMNYYYCINDIKEKQLISSYNKKNNHKREAAKKLREFKYQYVPQKNSFIYYSHIIDFSSPTIACIYESNIIDILSPPPK
jgi:hypothetical protein